MAYHDGLCPEGTLCEHFLQVDRRLLALSAVVFFSFCGRLLPAEKLAPVTTCVSLVMQTRDLASAALLTAGAWVLFSAATPKTCVKTDLNKILAAGHAVLEWAVARTEPWTALECTAASWALYILLRLLRMQTEAASLGASFAVGLLKAAVNQAACLLFALMVGVPDCRVLRGPCKDIVALCVLIVEASGRTLCKRTHGHAISRLLALFGAGDAVLPSYVPTPGTLLAPWDKDVDVSHKSAMACTAYPAFSPFFKRLFRALKAEALHLQAGGTLAPDLALTPDKCLVMCIEAVTCAEPGSDPSTPCACNNVFTDLMAPALS